MWIWRKVSEWDFEQMDGPDHAKGKKLNMVHVHVMFLPQCKTILACMLEQQTALLVNENK